MSCMMILATIFLVIQIFTGGGINYGLYAIVFLQFYGIRLDKMDQTQTASGVFAGTVVYGLCLLLSISHIYNLITVSGL